MKQAEASQGSTTARGKWDPFPLELMQEWEELEADMATAISFVPERAIHFIRERVVPKVAFDDSLFTRREVRLIHELSTNFANELTKPLIGFTHEPGTRYGTAAGEITSVFLTRWRSRTPIPVVT